MARIKGDARVVVVGDNGAAVHAETSQQLAEAVSVSVWDLSTPGEPVRLAVGGTQQVSCWWHCVYGTTVILSFCQHRIKYNVKSVVVDYTPYKTLVSMLSNNLLIFDSQLQSFWVTL